MKREVLAGAVLDLHRDPVAALDALVALVRGRYDDSAADALERLNEAREALVELESRPYEPDEMDLSREDRQRRDDDAAEVQS